MIQRGLSALAALTLLLPAVARPQDRASSPSRASVRADSSANIGLKQVAIGVGGLAILLLADPTVARAFQGPASAGTLNTARQFDRFGEPSGMVPIIAGVAVVGLVARDRPVMLAALHAVESVVLASVVTQGGKYLIGRIRPAGDPDLDGFDFALFANPHSPAFPSGHAAGAFALATSLGDAIDKTWARVGLYGLAAGTGWARLAEEQHWLTDVMAGAAVGIVSAKFVSGRLRIFGVRAPHFIVGPESMGLGWTF